MLVNHSPSARDLQTFLVFFQHPAWVITPVVNCLMLSLSKKAAFVCFVISLNLSGKNDSSLSELSQ